MERENYCTLYIVRHGQTEWNAEKRTMGHSDSPLTELGVQQADFAAEELKAINFDAVFSSDSGRTQRTAEIIKLDRELIIQTSALLRERNFGSYEGKLGSEFREAVKHKLEEREKLSEDDQWSFKLADDVETDGELVERFITKVREIAVAYPGKTVLVVSHGGCIRNFLVKLGYARREDLPAGSFGNGGYIKVKSDGVDFILGEVKNPKLKDITAQ